ncbi:MAG: Smr/MutS family protein [Alphaproteobacteria bacterium]|nr:Smr/MutS family protein [Alphaproteobacteria bacterium]
MGKARATRWPSTQDLDLFHKVVADVTPLRPEPAPSTRPIVKGVEAKAAKKPKTSIATPAPSSPSNYTPAVFPASLNDYGPGRSPGLDKRSALRLQRGKREIDGRIDLHGMTQTEARSALTGFVTNGHRHGRRCLLVITGKGRRLAQEHEMSWGGGEVREIGVLRRMVPSWLKDEPLRGCVLAYSQAQPKDGGSGALYVLLKRRQDS